MVVLKVVQRKRWSACAQSESSLFAWIPFHTLLKRDFVKQFGGGGFGW
jgi:hypothetical protein